MHSATESGMYLYHVILLGAAITGSLRSRTNSGDRALRVFTLLLWLTFLAESGAWIASYVIHNSQLVYAIFNPLQLLFAGLYFNALIAGFRKWHIGQIVGGVGILAAIANALWLQPPTTANTNFLILDGLATICMALWFFARLMLTDTTGHSIMANPHFRLSVLLTFFWAVTFCGWAAISYYHDYDKSVGKSLYSALLLLNLAIYGSFLLVLLRYPKMQPHTV